jgi:uncharacterized protein YegL
LLFFIFINACLLTAWGVFYNVPEVRSPDQTYAAAVANFQIGQKNNGTPVEPSHADPSLALGPPEREEGNNFVSLGFGGQIILLLEELPQEARPERLEVVESDPDSSECEDDPERIEVYVGADLAVDLADWVPLGAACKGETFDVSGLERFNFVYIVDISNPDEFSKGEDGYDLDGIVLTYCRDCPESTPTPLPNPVATPIVPSLSETVIPSPALTNTPTSAPPAATETPGAASTATSMPTGTTGVEFCQANTLDVVLVMDRSESMRGGPLADAREAAKHFVELIALETNQIGLVSFSQRAVLEQALTGQQALLEQAIENLEPSAGSNMAAGIALAESELTGTNHNSLAIPVMILLSDGRFDEEDPSGPAQIAKQAGIRIITVGIGRRVNESTMRSIASSETDYHYSPATSDLVKIYQDIAQAIYCESYPATNTPAAVITPPREVPIALAHSVIMDEDSTRAIRLTGSGSALTFSVVVQPLHGTLSGTAPDLFYTAINDYTGLDSFTFVVHDGVQESAPATVTITINAVNDAAVPESDFYETLAGTMLDVPSPGVLGNDRDVDGDLLTVRRGSSPRNGAVSLNPNGSFTYVPDPEFSGRDSFTYLVNDGTTSSTEATVNIEVRSVNTAPSADAQSVTMLEDTVGEAITLTGSDSDGAALTFTVISRPTYGQLSGRAPDLTYIPDANFHGSDTFTYKVSDGLQESAPATVNITVMPLNDAPEAADDLYAMEEDGVLEIPNPGILSNDSDVDGDPLTIIRLSNPSHGRLVMNGDGSFTYAPHLYYHGPDRFNYKLNDGQADSNVGTISITVGPKNDAPFCRSNIHHRVEAGDSLDLSSDCTDPDRDTLEYEVITEPEHGALRRSTGKLIYTPDPDYSGADSFSYLVSDGSGNRARAVVQVAVTPAQSKPPPTGRLDFDKVNNVIDAINNAIDIFLKVGGALLIIFVTVILTVTPPRHFWWVARFLNNTPELRRALALTPLLILLGFRMKQHHLKAVVANRTQELKLRSLLTQTPANEFAKNAKLTYDIEQKRRVTKRLIRGYKQIRQQIEEWRHK